MPTRADVVAVARGFIGTPYQHRGRTPGLALDCAGVVICAARALGFVAPDFDIPPYTRSPDGSMLAFCRAHMDEVPVRDAQPGDVAVLVLDAEPQHLAILAEYRGRGLSLIHARSRRLAQREVGRVIETRLMQHACHRLVAAFSFRGIA